MENYDHTVYIFIVPLKIVSAPESTVKPHLRFQWKAVDLNIRVRKISNGGKLTLKFLN
jgi:hypothetical protein